MVTIAPKTDTSEVTTAVASLLELKNGHKNRGMHLANSGSAGSQFLSQSQQLNITSLL